MDVSGSLGVEQKGEKVRSPQRNNKKKIKGRIKKIGNIKRWRHPLPQ